MAHVDRSFRMQDPPTEAQRRFEEEIGWELHREEGFALVRAQPGQLRYSDGVIDERSDEQSTEVYLPPEVGRPFGTEATPKRVNTGAYAGLRELLARTIKVELTPDGGGTLVHIHGHAEGRLRDAIELLGTPGHWPEIRLTEGAPTEDR